MSRTSERHIPSFDARADLGKRWSDWTIHVTQLHGVNEVFDAPRRIILVELDDDGEDWAYAHALAHLELGHHHHAGAFPDEWEQDASGLARLWLGATPFAERIHAPDRDDDDGTSAAAA